MMSTIAKMWGFTSHFSVATMLMAGSLLVAGGAEAAPRCPNLAILLDQSASMNQNTQGFPEADRAKTKWGIATKALIDLNNRYAGRLPIGYTNFPKLSGQCTVWDTFRVPISSTSQVEVNNAMIENTFAGGSTPMCTAITALADEMAFKDPARKNVILLVTDGIPEAQCCGADPVLGTVNAISAAATQTNAIRTAVVGFGNLPLTDQEALNRMAAAGGLASSEPNRSFYLATDAASLNEAFGRIMHTLLLGDAGDAVLCEDGCYGTPCSGSQVCIQDKCVANPCSTMSCTSNQACLFTGTTASCQNACLFGCPTGSRCNNGVCVQAACGGGCPAGQSCNAAGKCEADALCNGLVCHQTQGCFAGKCVDNPCRYTMCPTGTQCVDFSGACTAPPDDMMAGASGCSCHVSPGGGAPASVWWSGLGTLIPLGIYLSRRRRARGRA